MIAYSMTAKVLKTYTLNEGKGFRLNISLGGREGNSKGFANVTWFWRDVNFNYMPQVGDKVFIPKFDMSLSTYTNPNTGIITQNLNIFTNYLEKAPDYEAKIKEAKQTIEKAKQVTAEPTIHKRADKVLENVNWDDDTLASTEPTKPIFTTDELKVDQDTKNELLEVLEGGDKEVEALRLQQEKFGKE